ncbi:MAG: tripartite-type tricarboxylate transporter receptor subunit TctC [Gammaproteobacteria bacterium]|jgi:tripartite-type tricarboxylate transporter receptor subunit TctC
MKKTLNRRRFGVLAASAAALVASVATTPIANAAVDFSGKRITILVPFNEGGGTDSYVRFLAPFYQRHLPGNPKIQVLNKSGAGGILGGNYFEQKAEKDGTWVFALSTSTLTNYALRDPRVKFDLANYIPIILSPRGTMQYVRKDLGVQDEKDIGAKLKKMQSLPRDKLVFGGKTPTSMGLALRIGLSLLDVEVKSVWGMKGNGPMALAFERGEFTVNFDNTLSYKNNRKKMIEDGIAVPLYTFGVLDDAGKFVRDPEAPNVPNWHEAYAALHGKAPSGPPAEAFEALFHMAVTMSKSLNLPAGTSGEVVAAWVDATHKIIADPEFIEKRKKIFGAYPQTIGAAAGPIRDKATTISPEARQWLAKYLKGRHDVELKM